VGISIEAARFVVSSLPSDVVVVSARRRAFRPSSYCVIIMHHSTVPTVTAPQTETLESIDLDAPQEGTRRVEDRPAQ